MPIRKSTMQEQVAQAIAQINPSDRPIVTIHTVTGPSPWLMDQLGLLAQAFVKYYFVTVTEQAVVFHEAGRMTAAPQGAGGRDTAPRGGRAGQRRQAPGDVELAGFQLPGEAKPTRLNVGRYWRNELDQSVPAVTGQQINA